MTTPVAATGRREQRGDAAYLVLERQFRAPVEAVWSAVTEPERLVRWIGTWSGDPASGAVDFRMTAEGEDVEVEVFRIVVCEPPHRLVTESTSGDDPTLWRLELDLAELDGVTTLTFAQRLEDGISPDDVGPGWEYYLDRLVAAETGADPDGVDFEGDYLPLAEAYRSRFS